MTSGLWRGAPGSGEDGGVSRPQTSVVLAGLAAWLLVSLPTCVTAHGSPRFPVWVVAWLACGAAMVVASRRVRLDGVAAGALALQGAAVAVMVGLLCNGFEGMLLVFVAAQLGRIAALRVGIA